MLRDPLCILLYNADTAYVSSLTMYICMFKTIAMYPGMHIQNFLFTKEHGWVLFLYIWLLLPILYFAWLVGTYKGWLNILSSLCMLLQPIITFRIVQLGWRVFRSKVSLPKKDVLDALQYSVRAGWGIFRLLFASHLTNVVWFSVCGVIQKVNAVSVIKSQIFSICGYGGSITFLSGASAMLIFQQRCSFKNMKKLQALVEDQTACLADFKTAKKSIKSREEITPINFILVSAAFNTIVSAIMILASDAGSMIELSEVVVFSIGIIGRQVIVLLWILWECTCINEIPDQIADEMVLTEWKGESERNRISLHTAFRHSSIGSEIFFYRPNRNEILLQMLATAGSVVFSVCYKLLLSVQGQQ